MAKPATQYHPKPLDATWMVYPVTLHGTIYDPSSWVLTRANNVIDIVDPIHGLIDDPPDTGQTDLEAIIWGIGWLHVRLRALGPRLSLDETGTLLSH